MNRKVTTLLEVLREQKAKKGRPLKIIADWDDCLQPVKPKIIYLESNLKIPLKIFFEEFWELTEMTSSSVSAQYLEDFQGGNSETEKALKKFVDERKKNNKPVKITNAAICLKPDYQGDFYKNGELLSLADDLLQASQEGLIAELIIITANQKTSAIKIESPIKEKERAKIEGFVKEKREKIENTFGKLPNAVISITEVVKGPDGRFSPHRWEVIRDKFPDFDMYIDDNPSLIANSPSTLKFMNQIPNIKDKIFVLNDYKSNRKVTGPNIYHVKTTISDLKDEDFVIAAEEYKKNQAAKEKAAQEPKNEQISGRERERERESNIWKQPTLYWVLAGITWITFLLIALRRKKIFK